MEACGGAHHWARALSGLGHAVRLMSPALVAPYRTGHKHDRNDADAICEAVRRPRMRFVAVKSVPQQDLLALHRVRTQLLKQRIALSNQVRALLHARGARTSGAAQRGGRAGSDPGQRAPHAAELHAARVRGALPAGGGPAGRTRRAQGPRLKTIRSAKLQPASRPLISRRG
jgi:transposase